MANNTHRIAVGLLNDILGVEEHLRAGTAPREGGWGTASAGEREDQRRRLRGLRRRLQTHMALVPPAGLAELRRLLDEDIALGAEYLDLQLLAARVDSDWIAFPNTPPERWED